MKTLKALTSSLLLLSAAAALFVFVYQPFKPARVCGKP